MYIYACILCYILCYALYIIYIYIYIYTVPEGDPTTQHCLARQERAKMDADTLPLEFRWYSRGTTSLTLRV